MRLLSSSHCNLTYKSSGHRIWHERHGVWNHRWPRVSSAIDNKKAHTCSALLALSEWNPSVDSSDKGLFTLKRFSCHDVFMEIKFSQYYLTKIQSCSIPCENQFLLIRRTREQMEGDCYWYTEQTLGNTLEWLVVRGRSIMLILYCDEYISENMHLYVLSFLSTGMARLAETYGPFY